MLIYALERLFGVVSKILFILFITFVLMRLAPGGPFDSERDLPDFVRDQLNDIYHLNKPIFVQLYYYIQGLLKGDLGLSFHHKDFLVTELIRDAWPISMKLGFIAIAIALVIGSLLGILSALRRRSWLDHLITSFSMVGITIPNFVVAPLLTLIFGVWFHLLPVGGWGNGDFYHIVLPVISLSLPQIAYVSRLIRAAMIDVLQSQFIRAARAKGISKTIILLRHGLKPSLIPVIAYLGPAVASVITGSVVIEKIYGIPGLGRHLIAGALNRDYTLVISIVLLYSIVISCCNFLADIAQVMLDPRFRHDGKKHHGL